MWPKRSSKISVNWSRVSRIVSLSLGKRSELKESSSCCIITERERLLGGEDSSVVDAIHYQEYQQQGRIHLPFD